MLSLRKLNSILVIIIILLLAYHAIISALCMAEIISYTPDMVTSGLIVLAFVIIHIVISLYLFVKDKIKQKKIRVYNDINKDIRLQAISGIFIIIFAVAHVLSYIYIPSFNANLISKIIHFIIDILLFITVFIHLQISIPRLLVSLGFLTGENDYEKSRKIVKVILGVGLILLIIAEVIYYIL